MAYGDLKVRNLIWNTGSGDNTVVFSDIPPKNNPTFTGTVTVPTAPASDVSTKAASTAFVDAYYATKAAPAFTGSATGVNLTLSGNLVVNGTTTTINTQTLDVEDINITLGKVSSPSDTTANNGGITLKGATDKTFNWLNASQAWTSSEHIQVNDGKKIIIGTDSDLQIIHGGGTSQIHDIGSGNLDVKKTGSGQLRFVSESGGSEQVGGTYTPAGGWVFNHAGASRIQTNTSGIVVSGRLLLGHSTNLHNYNLQVLGADENSSSQSLSRFSNSGSSSVLEFNKSRNGSIGGNTIVSANDTVGVIRFKGADGTDYSQVADMQAAIDGTPGNNDTPGRLMFSTTADGAQYTSERLRISSTGAFGIAGANYGSSGQVLTSGGSGAAPSWTTISAAPTVELVADGAITAGKPCIVTTAGKAKQVAAAPVGINPVTRNSGSEASQSGTGGEYLQGTYAECVAYDPDSDTVAVAQREDGNGNAKVYLFSTNGDNLVYRTVTVLLSNNSNQSGSMSITTLPNRRYLATYYDSANSGTTQVVILTVNANGDGWSAGSPTALKANGCYVAAIFGIHTTGGRVAFAVRGTGTSQLTNGRMALVCGDAGTTGSTWTYRSFSDNIFGEPTSYCISLDYDSTNDVIGVQAGNGSLMEIVGMRIASGTGANISKGTKYTLTTSTLNDSRHICKHVSGTTWASEWAAGTNGPIYLNTTTINSSLAISNGAQYTLSGSGNNHGVGLDVTNEGRLLLGWQHNDGVTKVKQYTLSGTTLTALSGETEILTSLSGKERFAFRYMGHNGMIAGFTTRGANGLGFGTADTTEDGSNMTAENYIGIAASTVSNNATATIDVSGATNSSQSSLTPGQKYYVQANGTLGLSEGTPKVFAGTAVAATKIIVNDQQPMPEDTGLGYDMWCVSADFGYYREWNRDQALGSGQTFTSPSGTYTMSISRCTTNQNPFFEKVGTGMSMSAGVWTFPATGVWQVTFAPQAVTQTGGEASQNMFIYTTSNNGGAWQMTYKRRGRCGRYTNRSLNWGPLIATFKITDTSNQKIKFGVGDGDLNMRFEGATDMVESHFVFEQIS